MKHIKTLLHRIIYLFKKKVKTKTWEEVSHNIKGYKCSDGGLVNEPNKDSILNDGQYWCNNCMICGKKFENPGKMYKGEILMCNKCFKTKKFKEIRK